MARLKKIYNQIPWEDSTTWKKGDWHPLAVGFNSRNQKEYIIDSYGVFRIDESQDAFLGDIYPVIGRGLTFTQALEICEDHNDREMIP